MIDNYQADLHQQQHATEKLRKKQESELANLTQQLKRSQNDQVLNLERDLEKIKRDYSDCEAENRRLETELTEMHRRLTHLYEDAEVVREQVNQEIREYRKAQS